MSFNYYPSDYRSLEASLMTRATRSIAGSIVFLCDRKKPVTREETAGEGGEREYSTRCQGLQRQVQELLDEKDQSVKNEDQY